MSHTRRYEVINLYCIIGLIVGFIFCIMQQMLGVGYTLQGVFSESVL